MTALASSRIVDRLNSLYLTVAFVVGFLSIVISLLIDNLFPIYFISVIAFTIACVYSIMNPTIGLIIFLSLAPFHFLIYRVIDTYISSEIAARMVLWKDIIVILALFGCFRYKYFLRANFLDLFVLLYVMYQIFYVVFDLDIFSLKGLSNNVRFLLIYLVVRWCRPNQIRTSQIIRLIVLINIFVVVSGLIQWLFVEPKYILLNLGWDGSGLGDAYAGPEKFPRALSVLLAANELGLTSSILLFSFLLGIPKSNWNKGFLSWLLIIVTVIVLLLSLSRSSWLGTLFGITILCLYRRRVRLYIMQIILIMLALLPFLLLGSTTMFSSFAVIQRILAVFEPDDPSTAARLTALPDQIATIQSHPLGIGLGLASRASFGSDKIRLYSESNYLQVAIETGWLGILLMILMVTMFLASIIRKISQSTGSHRELALWALTASASIFAAALVFPSLGYLLPPAQMAILAGLALNQTNK